jgi:hypothetical protein
MAVLWGGFGWGASRRSLPRVRRLVAYWPLGA